MEREWVANEREGAVRGINFGHAHTRRDACRHLGSRYRLYLKLIGSHGAIKASFTSLVFAGLGEFFPGSLDNPQCSPLGRLLLGNI
jgi:hypothetical protein